MQSKLGHIQFNIQPTNVAFYKDLFTAMGWQTIFTDDNMVAVGDQNGVSLWFVGQVKAVTNDYDGPGMNHLALAVSEQGTVDEAAAYLTQQGVALLFETPRHRPEFTQSPEQTYYQVMFETPDRILLEVVYVGVKAE
ncbi:MAG: hypothetical protein R3E79_28060 [Caldilineaceae bacterium]